MSPRQSYSPKDTPLDGRQANGEPGSLSRTSSLGDHIHPLRHRNSAISLLGRGESGNKALAEIGTSAANAVGSVDGTFNREMNSRRPSASAATITPGDRGLLPPPAKYQPPHSYSGNDPTVLKLLESLYLEHFPSESIDFGPVVVPVRGRQPIKRNGGNIGPWKPEGTLVALLNEHTASVNRIAVSPDQAFFISGSDDGTVKVWDTKRLERNITHRSRQTHKHAAEAKITSLTFVQDTLSFISTATDGSIHIVRVQHDVQDADRGTLRYSKLRLVREYQLKEDQYAVWSEHYKAEDNRSILVIATNDSHIIAIDLRNMSVIYDLKNPLSHGTPTAFCIDKKHQWLLLGTTHGVLDLWDLRFLLRLKSWGFPGGAPIHRLMFTPVKHGGQKDRVIVAGGTGHGEVTIWDMQKNICKEVYRVGVASSKENLKFYKLVDIDEEKPSSMLGRFATAIDPAPSGSGTGVDRGIRSIATGMFVLEDGLEARKWFMLASGPDWKVRFWDVYKPEASCVVSGLHVDERPSYSVTSHKVPDISIVQEHLHQAVDSRPQAGSRDGTPKKGSSAKPQPRSRLVSAQTQNLLKSNLDTIMDVALLELPYGMVISADRAGVIYVFA